MTDSPEEEEALEADARAYHAELPITEKINAFLEIQGIDLTTAFNHCSLGNFLIECRDRIDELEELLIELSCECPYHCEYDWVMEQCPHKKAAIMMEKK